MMHEEGEIPPNENPLNNGYEFCLLTPFASVGLPKCY